jgi:hypothetical protein
MGIELGIEILGFWGNISRRGTHVNTLEIGSRGGNLCFGGIMGFRADLRRELDGGELKLVVFWNLGGDLTWGWEEGGHLCVFGSVVGFNWIRFCEFLVCRYVYVSAIRVYVRNLLLS